MRIAFALSGFHRVDRGAEVALLAVAQALGEAGEDVTVFGSGQERPGTSYRFQHVPAIKRERFERIPAFPVFRGDVMWEDASFAAALSLHYRPSRFDVAVTCAYPFTQWLFSRPALGRRPRSVFVTQNGDWPAFANNSEYRFFRCDGLVCTNPDFLERNRENWRCALIPNGVDLPRFAAGKPSRTAFGLPDGVPLVLMVSAFIESKRVADGVRAVAAMEGVHLAVAGDGHLRDEVEALARDLMPGRFTRLSLKAHQMPDLYASADVFLHMSELESFGNVFLEAMASGLPIVGHDTQRLRWIVGDNQPLCDTTAPAALSSALGRALGRGRGDRDPRADEYGWPIIGARYREFFQTLVPAS